MWMREVLVAASIATPAMSGAAELTSFTSKEGRDVIILKGEISQGDTAKFVDLVRKSNAAGRAVSGIRLNSPGGNLAEGLQLAKSIRTANIASVVPNGSQCASACFLAFAAGAEKFVSYSARVGVHGASDQQGRETTAAAAATVVMSREARDFGVPAVVIGKMVTTPPEQMLWLSPNDLRAMGATLTGRPDQTNAPAIVASRPESTLPMQLPSASDAKKRNWPDLVAAAISASAQQNSGKPRLYRQCQPELKTCSTAIFVKFEDGDLMLRTTSDLNGATTNRDFCAFNSFGDIRRCVNWDTAVEAREMKNAKGDWIQVE